MSYLFLTLSRFLWIRRRGRKLQATFSGTNAVRPKGNHFPPYHPCVCAREVMVRALACVGVHLCVFHGACMRERAPLFPSCSTRLIPPGPSTRPAPSLVLETSRSSPESPLPQRPLLILSRVTRATLVTSGDGRAQPDHADAAGPSHSSPPLLLSTGSGSP